MVDASAVDLRVGAEHSFTLKAAAFRHALRGTVGRFRRQSEAGETKFTKRPP
jgi:hypothetical protein